VSRFSLAVAVAGALLLTNARPAAAAEPVKVALLPIVVHSQDRAEYLQAGISDMLMSRLSQTAGLGVVRIADLKAATTDLETARSAARAIGARYVVFGSFTSFGDGASLDLQCARTDASDEGARQVFVQSGALGSIIPRLDDLAERVARYVADPGAGGTLPAVSAAPLSKGSVSRAEVDDLRRRVDALEETTRSHATTASGLPPAPKPEPAPQPGSRASPSSR
jgi:TolB-like protein